MTKPKWIIFDVGGVILDWHSSKNAVIRTLGLTREEFDPVFENYLKPMESGSVSSDIGVSGILKDLNSCLSVKDFFEIWINNYEVIQPIADLLFDIKDIYHLGICTNTWTGVIKQTFPRFSFFEYFKIIVDSSVEKVAKPNQKIYQIVEDRTGVKGNNILFIDDSKENIDSASAFGWQVFHFQFGDDQGYQSTQELEKLVNTFQ